MGWEFGKFAKIRVETLAKNVTEEFSDIESTKFINVHTITPSRHVSAGFHTPIKRHERKLASTKHRQRELALCHAHALRRNVSKIGPWPGANVEANTVYLRFAASTTSMPIYST